MASPDGASASASSTAIPTGLATSLAPTEAVNPLGTATRADGLVLTPTAVKRTKHGTNTQRKVEHYSVLVKACSAGPAVDIFLDRWWLLSSDGHGYSASLMFWDAPLSGSETSTPDPSPYLGYPDVTVPSKGCVTGWFNVNVPDGTVAAWLTYEPVDGQKAVWRVPS